jgi:hypothetical protein
MSLAENNLEASQLMFVIFFPDDNDLRGPIPTEIGLLTGLIYLDFGELLDRKVASTPRLLLVSL